MSDFHYEVERTDHYFFENFTAYGKAIQDGTPTPSEPVDIQVVQGGNLLISDATTKTVNGVTFTVNDDGSVTANGTATATIVFDYHSLVTPDGFITLDPGIYMLSGCPAGGSNSTWKLDLESNGLNFMVDYGSGVTTTITSSAAVTRCRIVVYRGVTINETFCPQLEAGSTATPYVPYGSIGIVIGGTATSIPLQGNVLASLPDGTKDVLTVDSAGHCVLTKRVGYVGTSALSTHVAAAATLTDYVRIACSNAISDNPAPTSTPALNRNGYCNVAQFTGAGYGVNTLHCYAHVTSFYVFAPIGDKSTWDTTTAAEWLTEHGVYAYYTPANEQTIDLGYIDVSYLKNISEEIPLSIISTLNPETEYSYINRPSYDVLNPYEDYNAPEYAFPPNHMGQKWETFDANDWNETDMLDYTGQMESHAVYTIELCELMQSGAFDWSRPEIDWSETAYSQEQYERFCKYFETRFMFREISIIPPLEWFTALRRMLVFELMPKYKPLYEQVESGLAPLGENEYYKRRHITSNYPETLLSGNSDYITTGDDEEFERVKVDNAAQAMKDYRDGFASVDKAMADELEVLFVSMYTSYANGL